MIFYIQKSLGFIILVFDFKNWIAPQKQEHSSLDHGYYKSHFALLEQFLPNKYSSLDQLLSMTFNLEGHASICASKGTRLEKFINVWCLAKYCLNKNG